LDIGFDNSRPDRNVLVYRRRRGSVGRGAGLIIEAAVAIARRCVLGKDT